MVLLRCHFTQVVADCREALFLGLEHVVDGRRGYAEVDLEPCLPLAVDLSSFRVGISTSAPTT